MNVNTKALSALGIALGITTSTGARAAGAQDEVDLVDGTTLHGKITQQVPGSYVVIESDDGRVESLPWSQVKRVSAVSPPVAPAAVPAAPATTATTTSSPTPSTSPQEPEPVQTPARDVDLHFELGARLGYAFASGNYVSGLPIGSPSGSAGAPGISGAIPLTFDLGMRIGKYVFVGGFTSYAFLSTTCASAPAGYTLQCDGHDVRGGIDAQIHIVPRGKVDPWIGFGLGHEWLTVSMSTSAGGSTASESQTLEGWNFADVMLGLDMHVARGLGVGPFLEFTSGSFGSESASQTGGGSTQSGSVDFSSTSSHQWFTVGARGTFEVF
jgi:hypothetical protein